MQDWKMQDSQLPQNLEWPHDTRATPERGAMRHTSQSSAATDGCVELETSPPAADVDLAELEACAGSAGAASMSSSSLASGADWNASVCAPRLWDMARKNCIRV